MIHKAIERIEGIEAQFWQWALGFVGILYVRFFLENLSSPTPSFPATPDAATLVHYFLFFFGIFISLTLVLSLVLGDPAKTTKFLFFGFPVVWLPPLFDLVISHGAGWHMAYPFPTNIFGFFITTVWAPNFSLIGGITPGLYAEMLVILIGVFGYTLFKTNNFWKAVLAILLAYSVWAFWFIVPALIAAIYWIFHPAMPMESSLSLLSSFLSAVTSPHMLQNLIPQNALVSSGRATEIIFNSALSAIYFFVDLFLFAIWCLCISRNAAFAIIKNLRPERMAYYASLILLGGAVAIHLSAVAPIFAPIDWLYFGCLIMSFVSAFAFAIGVNDLADEKIDAVSNIHRPLPSGVLNRSDFAAANLFFLSWSLLGGFICGYWAFFAIVVFTAAYYIYSAKPMRLKRIPLVAAFLISIASLSAVMAGFYFVDPGKLISDISMRLVVLVIVCVTLAANIKDVKDIEGDRADDIWTIPVIFGEARGKMIVGALLAISFLMVLVIAGNWALFIPSLLAAILGYVVVNAKHYRERRIFALYFTYLIIVGLIFFI